MQLYSGEDSLVDSFPHALEKMEGARRYISAFRVPLQELSPTQVHTMRACSLLVIPPPKERQPPSGGFPKDLSDLNLSSWAGLVQDVASGLMAPPHNLASEVSLVAVALLDLLQKATGWVYCRFCYNLGSWCACMGAFPPSWSQVAGELPGCGATASSGGMTAPGMPAAGYLPPPPGLPPIDYSKWRLPLPGAPASGGAPAPPNLPGVRRSAGLRGTAKRIVGAPHPGRLTQRMPAPPTTMLCMPQTMPVQQPHPKWPTTSYQQVVKPPKRPAGRGVIADTPADKTIPMGGTMQDHRRPTVRGQGHGSHSISRSRGVPVMASAQPPHQEGGLSSGLMPSAPPPPPPPAPERAQPQWRGWTRSALRDPTRLAANFWSSGWRKDLEHILKVYYKYSVDHFTESDWSRVKDRFFDHFLQHKKEALELKEACPLDFMAYIQDLFYQATSIHLDGLRTFTHWIKRGSYYHGIVAQQGCLQECPHLAGAPLPRWPQVAPSESRRESQMKSEAQTPSSSRPSAGATVVPVVETPIAEAPVAEAAVTETSAMEETPAEAPIAPPSPPAPMETGGMGDGQSWVEQVEAVEEEPFQRSRPAKCTRSQSRRREPTSQLPFPLQDGEGRFASTSQLYEHAAAQPATPHNVAGRVIMHLHPDLLPQKATCLGNQVACMIAEYHLTASARQLSLHPIIPHEVAPLLPPLKNYVPGVSFEGTWDVRVMDHAVALRVAVWLHQLDMAVGGELLASESLEAGQHYLGPLLESFLTPRMSGLTYQKVVDHVLTENRRAYGQSLRHLQEHRTHGREALEGLIKVHGELDKADKTTRKSLKKEIDQRCKGLKTLKEHISHYEAQLGQEPSEGSAPGDDSQIHHGAQAEVAPAPLANDAPSESTVTPAPDPSPAEDQAQDMEVDDYAIHPSLPSPVFREDDELLLGLPQSEVTEVESGLAHLTVSSPRGLNGEGEEASL